MKSKLKAVAEGASEVGYRRPPKQFQFKKGQSGNRSGRPKTSKSLYELVIEAIDEQVVVHENGASKRISKRQAAAKQLANKAAKGELASLKMLFQLLATFEPQATPELTSDQSSALEEIDEMLDRFAAQRREAANDTGSSKPDVDRDALSRMNSPHGRLPGK